jgi:uncharacterized membrane protein YraQ (UPF0718 family)
MLEYYFYLAACLCIVVISAIIFSVFAETCRSLNAKVIKAARAQRAKEASLSHPNGAKPESKNKVA